MVILTNVMTNITRTVMLCSAIVVIVVSIIGFIKAKKIKKARRHKLGYDSLTVVAQVNILKKKSEKYHKLGCIPTGLNDLYQGLTRDSATGYAKYLNKLLRKHKKGKRYYTKKNKNADSYISNQVMHSVGVFYNSHLNLFKVTGKPNITRIY